LGVKENWEQIWAVYDGRNQINLEDSNKTYGTAQRSSCKQASKSRTDSRMCPIGLFHSKALCDKNFPIWAVPKKQSFTRPATAKPVGLPNPLHEVLQCFIGHWEKSRTGGISWHNQHRTGRKRT